MAITINPSERQPVEGDARINKDLEITEVFDGRKWVEVAIASSRFPMPGRSIGLPDSSHLTTGITSIGIGDTGVSSISALSAVSGIRAGECPKTVFNTYPALKIASLDHTLARITPEEFTHRHRNNVHEYVKENMPECGKCHCLEFQEEKHYETDATTFLAICGHRGAKAGCTTIICPNGTLSVKEETSTVGSRLTYIPLLARQSDFVEPKPYTKADLDRPATLDGDAW